MKKLLFTLFATALLLTSCGPDPVKFNDSMVSLMTKAQKDYESVHESYEKLLEEEKYDQMGTISKSAVDSLNVRLEAVKKLEVPSNGEEFQAASISFIEALIAAAKEYDKLEIMGKEDATNEEIQAAVDAIEAKDDAVDSAFDSVTSMQKEFAKKKNIELR
ncbi:hypothetical protein D0T53_02815 [Dysgonomonas sp. 216]|uniref:hypothetical protein n=1 Tax=Dysgonomonas sp. 216 TaxID=2302934 RepID=UPI0013D34252|nr:hypothetical protein [Dysgonomonas sp. 216]NDW17848.1 hypothetical protein [Dysgonomonas sp. 216]